MMSNNERVIGVMEPGETYPVREIAAATNIHPSNVIRTLKSLAHHGAVEMVEPEPIEYPEWWEYAGETSRRSWRRRNNIVTRNGKPIPRWRRR